MSNLISCKSVSKSFGAQTLFQNIDLMVDGGDRIGVIGPNGSGKSTLLKIICGLEEPDSGQLLIRKFARLSYLAQEDLVREGKSIREDLMAALEGEDLEEAEKHYTVDALLSRAEFAEIGRAHV